ncbi:MAG: hypothetical protein ACI8RD_010015, partial [Bacillariaceae sp.]
GFGGGSSFTTNRLRRIVIAHGDVGDFFFCFDHDDILYDELIDDDL